MVFVKRVTRWRSLFPSGVGVQLSLAFGQFGSSLVCWNLLVFGRSHNHLNSSRLSFRVSIIAHQALASFTLHGGMVVNALHIVVVIVISPIDLCLSNNLTRLYR